MCVKRCVLIQIPSVEIMDLCVNGLLLDGHTHKKHLDFVLSFFYFYFVCLRSLLIVVVSECWIVHSVSSTTARRLV